MAEMGKLRQGSVLVVREASPAHAVQGQQGWAQGVQEGPLPPNCPVLSAPDGEALEPSC